MIPRRRIASRANLYQSNGGVQAHHPPRTVWRNRGGLTRPASIHKTRQNIYLLVQGGDRLAQSIYTMAPYKGVVKCEVIEK